MYKEIGDLCVKTDHVLMSILALGRVYLSFECVNLEEIASFLLKAKEFLRSNFFFFIPQDSLKISTITSISLSSVQV